MSLFHGLMAGLGGLGLYSSNKNAKKQLNLQRELAEHDRAQQLRLHELEKSERGLARERKNQYNKALGSKKKDLLTQLSEISNKFYGEGGKLKPLMDEQALFLNDTPAYFDMLNQKMKGSEHDTRAKGDMADLNDNLGNLQGSSTNVNEVRRKASNDIMKDALYGFNDFYQNKQRQAKGDIESELGQMQQGKVDEYQIFADELADELGIDLDEYDTNHQFNLGNTATNMMHNQNMGQIAQQGIANKQKGLEGLTNLITQQGLPAMGIQSPEKDMQDEIQQTMLGQMKQGNGTKNYFDMLRNMGLGTPQAQAAWNKGYGGTK